MTRTAFAGRKKKNISASTKIMHQAQMFAGFPVFLLARDPPFFLNVFNLF
jgi:hypothetical protein